MSWLKDIESLLIFRYIEEWKKQGLYLTHEEILYCIYEHLMISNECLSIDECTLKDTIRLNWTIGRQTDTFLTASLNLAQLKPELRKRPLFLLDPWIRFTQIQHWIEKYESKSKITNFESWYGFVSWSKRQTIWCITVYVSVIYHLFLLDQTMLADLDVYKSKWIELWSYYENCTKSIKIFKIWISQVLTFIDETWTPFLFDVAIPTINKSRNTFFPSFPLNTKLLIPFPLSFWVCCDLFKSCYQHDIEFNVYLDFMQDEFPELKKYIMKVSCLSDSNTFDQFMVLIDLRVKMDPFCIIDNINLIPNWKILKYALFEKLREFQISEISAIDPTHLLTNFMFIPILDAVQHKLSGYHRYFDIKTLNYLSFNITFFKLLMDLFKRLNFNEECSLWDVYADKVRIDLLSCVLKSVHTHYVEDILAQFSIPLSPQDLKKYFECIQKELKQEIEMYMIPFGVDPPFSPYAIETYVKLIYNDMIAMLSNQPYLSMDLLTQLRPMCLLHLDLKEKARQTKCTTINFDEKWEMVLESITPLVQSWLEKTEKQVDEWMTRASDLENWRPLDDSVFHTDYYVNGMQMLSVSIKPIYAWKSLHIEGEKSKEFINKWNAMYAEKLATLIWFFVKGTHLITDEIPLKLKKIYKSGIQLGEHESLLDYHDPKHVFHKNKIYACAGEAKYPCDEPYLSQTVEMICLKISDLCALLEWLEGQETFISLDFFIKPLDLIDLCLHEYMLCLANKIVFSEMKQIFLKEYLFNTDMRSILKQLDTTLKLVLKYVPNFLSRIFISCLFHSVIDMFAICVLFYPAPNLPLYVNESILDDLRLIKSFFVQGLSHESHLIDYRMLMHILLSLLDADSKLLTEKFKCTPIQAYPLEKHGNPFSRAMIYFVLKRRAINGDKIAKKFCKKQKWL